MESNKISDFLHPEFDLICSESAAILSDLREQTILITGGTGFFGKWLVLALNCLNDQFGLNLKIKIICRDPVRAIKSDSWIFSREHIELISGDVLNLGELVVRCDLIIHAATEATVQTSFERLQQVFQVASRGTLEVLNLASRSGAKKVLVTSSGAVYGRQPPSVDKTKETDFFGVNTLDPQSAYALGKMSGEFFCSTFSDPQVSIIIARCFAFVGPFLPLGKHFAIGNFIQNAKENTDFHIQGDGRPLRSYMYAADLSLWLIWLLLRGRHLEAYNVGSDQAVSILELANTVKAVTGSKGQVLVHSAQGAGPAHRYVPSHEKTQSEIGLKCWTTLETSIERTFQFAKLF